MMDNGEKPAHEYNPMRYPFLSDTFPFEAPEFVVTDGAYEHLYAEPEECADPCAAQDEEIRDLEKELYDLKIGYYAQRESSKKSVAKKSYPKPTTTKSTYTRPTTKPSSSYKKPTTTNPSSSHKKPSSTYVKPSYLKYKPSYSAQQSYADKYKKSKADYADL